MNEQNVGRVLKKIGKNAYLMNMGNTVPWLDQRERLYSSKNKGKKGEESVSWTAMWHPSNPLRTCESSKGDDYFCTAKTQ